MVGRDGGGPATSSASPATSAPPRRVSAALDGRVAGPGAPPAPAAAARRGPRAGRRGRARDARPLRRPGARRPPAGRGERRPARARHGGAPGRPGDGPGRGGAWAWRPPSWPRPAGRTTSCCSARPGGGAPAVEAAAEGHVDRPRHGRCARRRWRGDPSAATWRGYEHRRRSAEAADDGVRDLVGIDRSRHARCALAELLHCVLLDSSLLRTGVPAGFVSDASVMCT